MNSALIPLLILISIILIIALTTRFRLHAFTALFIVSLLLAAVTLPVASIVSTLKEGFGSTMASIGFLIIFGAMIGVILDRTGATLSIAGYMLSKTGEKRSPVALGLTGFITGLPIFCDSGFIVLSGLAKSLSRKSAVSMPFMATVLATSLYSVHCLIPPHPGALAAAGIVDANVGWMIIVGTLFVRFPGLFQHTFGARGHRRNSVQPHLHQGGMMKLIHVKACRRSFFPFSRLPSRCC